MDYKLIKEKANLFLSTREKESSFIEYKKNEEKIGSVLKTICAYANNYMDNDYSYIFIGVEEENNENNKAIPILPIYGVKPGKLEIVKNKVLNLKSFIYPKISFEVLYNSYEGIDYVLIVVPRQLGGPFNVSGKAESEYSIKPGRYVRLEGESRIAKVNEEYDLLRKFSNYHFSTMINEDASIDDIDLSILREYLEKTSDRTISVNISKLGICKSLELLDDDEYHVKNLALLMFSSRPDKYIDNAYVELIVDINGDKKKMDFKTFKGPIWKQYNSIVDYIDNQFLNSIVVRKDNNALSRRVYNYPFTAIEELVANAIVHNIYENHKAVQIYILDKYISIVNYNKPLPPISIEDLNSKSLFIEKDFVNPVIRKMFKSLGIIESYGTGVGEAKLSLEKNGSSNLVFKEFNDDIDITSVMIPINEEYYQIKNGDKVGNDPQKVGNDPQKVGNGPQKVGNGSLQKVGNDPQKVGNDPQKVGNDHQKVGNDPQKVENGDNRVGIKEIIRASEYNKQTKDNLLKIYNKLGDIVFGNKDIAELLNCSDTTATKYIKKLIKLKVAKKVAGIGAGKYMFISE